MGEDMVLTLFIDVDDMTCPSCGIEGTMVVNTQEINGIPCYQIRCMNTECFHEAWVVQPTLQKVQTTSFTPIGG